MTVKASRQVSRAAARRPGDHEVIILRPLGLVKADVACVTAASARCGKPESRRAGWSDDGTRDRAVDRNHRRRAPHLTAGGIDAHIHFISRRGMVGALQRITTMIRWRHRAGRRHARNQTAHQRVDIHRMIRRLMRCR